MSSIATKRIAKNTVMLYIRMFLIMGMTLYTSRIVLAALGVVDFGIYNVVSGFVVMLSFLNGAMAQSTQRFMAYEIGQNNRERLKTTFKTAFTIHLIIALIIILLAETIGLWFLNCVMNIPADQMYAANWVYQCSILSFTISIIQVPYNACIIAHEKMQAHAYIGIIEVIMKFSVAFLISSVVSSERLIIYAVMLSGVSLLTCGFYITYCRRNFTECISGWYHERKLFNTMFGYAAWSTLGTFAWVCKSQGCNLILNIFFGPVINAAYGISAQVNTAVSNFVLNFTTAVNPQIVKSYSQDDFGNMQKLVTYGSKFSFFLMLLLSFPILLNTD
ncbi:MAG: lipopolysaccharide biosynthesis protein, partial [Prevotella sp.]|nr:lipopolysaccharide biosynthesis protein [Prevotella sp.]